VKDLIVLNVVCDVLSLFTAWLIFQTKWKVDWFERITGAICIAIYVCILLFRSIMMLDI
jgi:hypothetical protein